jgi:predicted  nucleic acid-binding Zn-ribbon protein
VFSYVNIRKGEGATPEQINAELAQGQRMEPPQEPAAIVAADERSELILLSIKLEQAQETITDLNQQLQDTRTERDKALGALENADTLRREQVDDLRQQLAQANEEIRKLYRDMARLEVGQGDE